MAKRKRVQLLRRRFASRGCAFLDLDCICRHFRAVAPGALLKEAPLWWWVEAVFLRIVSPQVVLVQPPRRSYWKGNGLLLIFGVLIGSRPGFSML